MKYTFNNNYFDKIDTENKSYILGFIFADGCVCSKQWSMTIVVHEQDEDILFKIKECLKSNHPINIVKNKYRRLRIINKHFVNTLINLGCTPRKSNVVKYPMIQVELNSHFIRGYFDGDGCLSIYKSKDKFYKRISIVSGSTCMIQSLLVILSLLNIKCNYLIDRKSTYVLYISRQKDVNVFLKYIYTDASIYLDRKYKYSVIPC